MNQLPPEIIDNILRFTNNETYFKCRQVSKLFHVSSKKEWIKRYYKNSDFYKILYAGDLGGVKYHLNMKSSLILIKELDPRLFESIKMIGKTTILIGIITAYLGHIHILHELIRYNMELPSTMKIFAVRGGQLEFLKYLHFIGYSGQGIGFYLRHYEWTRGIKWFKAITDGIIIQGIPIKDYNKHSEQSNHLQYKGSVYKW